MCKNLAEIAQDLKDSNKKVQLIYAFNGTGKTRLSKEFYSKSNMDNEEIDNTALASKKILYYNAFTEDLFYWDNDLEEDITRKLTIYSNNFTKWVFEDQGKEGDVVRNFQYYTNEKLTPHFNPEFTEVTFSYECGNNEKSEHIKISKGEESCFIWSIFYSLLTQVIEVLNIDKDSIDQERETDQFDNLEYVFIDDPVSSLDDNNLIEFAVQLSGLIKSSISEKLKFIITTHNPVFYNVLFNEFKNSDKKTKYKSKDFKNYLLIKNEDETYELGDSNDSPFSYHLYLLHVIKKAIENNQIHKYHFSLLRNVLEKTATFLGYSNWGELVTPISGETDAYIKRILNFSSHSKHSADEIFIITDNDKKVLKYLIEEVYNIYKFKEV